MYLFCMCMVVCVAHDLVGFNSFLPLCSSMELTQVVRLSNNLLGLAVSRPIADSEYAVFLTWDPLTWSPHLLCGLCPLSLLL